MRNKKRTMLIAIVAFVTIMTLAPYLFIQYQHYNIEKKVTAYLLNDKEYDQEDFEIVRTDIGKVPRYSADVVFKDEPKIFYIYSVYPESLIQVDVFTVDDNTQEDKMNSKFKHREY
ncbi:DUF3139 domain-containing protein [Caldalkalibacillus salinus]|uniref:DUF3139 domain-containing protein n=1 Tax=Caldalkalibacillus salinus TaxID=2803787 RepID=UPI0019211364|nr:DUF3139 domain-containing protein [Caldalkalibacillus salinus]